MPFNDESTTIFLKTGSKGPSLGTCKSTIFQSQKSQVDKLRSSIPMGSIRLVYFPTNLPYQSTKCMVNITVPLILRALQKVKSSKNCTVPVATGLQPRFKMGWPTAVGNSPCFLNVETRQPTNKTQELNQQKHAVTRHGPTCKTFFS